MSETAERDELHNQLFTRIEDLEIEKEALVDENARLLKDNDDLRQEVRGWRGA